MLSLHRYVSVYVCEREEGERNREAERLKGRKPYLLIIGQIRTRDKGIVKMRLVLKEGIDVLKKRRHILKLGFQYW